MEDRLEERKASYKRGVVAAEATQKRKDGGDSIRKQKRVANLAKRRQGLYAKREALPRGAAVEVNFNKNALLQTENPRACMEALSGLARYLCNRPDGETDEQMDAEVSARFVDTFYASQEAARAKAPPVVILKLAALCATTNVNMKQAVADAVDCLANVTGSRLGNYSLIVVAALLDAGFLRTVANHVFSLHANKNPLITPKILANLWKVVANMCIECPESRDAVLHSPVCRYAGNGPCPQGWKSPLVMELSRLCAENTPAAQRDGLLPPLLQLICCIVESGNKAPAWEWTQSVWPYMLQILDNIPRQRVDQMEPHMHQMLTYILGTLMSLFKGRNHPELFKLVKFNPRALMSVLASWYTYVKGGNRERIADVVAAICSLQTPRGDKTIPRVFIETKWLTLMTGSLGDTDSRIRRKAAHFLGNLACEGFDFAEAITLPDKGSQPHRDTMRALMHCADKDVAHVHNNAVYAITTCFMSANNDRIICLGEGNTRGSERGLNVMLNLIRHYGMFHILARFVGTTYVDECVWVLGVIEDAMKWNPKLVFPLLDEAGIVNSVEDMLDCTHEALVDPIEAVSVLLHLSSEREEMDLATSMGAGDGTPQGQFGFGGGGGGGTGFGFMAQGQQHQQQQQQGFSSNVQMGNFTF